jgi:hypothetical protein
MDPDPSSRSPSPTPGSRLQLGDSFERGMYPFTVTTANASGSGGGGGGGVRRLTHSETIDGLSAPHISVYNQSVRAWMWSRGTLSCKRALSEQSGDGHNHLWHPPGSIMGKQTKRTSAPQVRLFSYLPPSMCFIFFYSRTKITVY